VAGLASCRVYVAVWWMSPMKVRLRLVHTQSCRRQCHSQTEQQLASDLHRRAALLVKLHVHWSPSQSLDHHYQYHCMMAVTRQCLQATHSPLLQLHNTAYAVLHSFIQAIYKLHSNVLWECGPDLLTPWSTWQANDSLQ